jgi:hypothetical protein
MITPEECERECRDPLAFERRSKMQFSHLEHRAASAETAEVSQFLQSLFERVISPIFSIRPMQYARYTVSKQTPLIPH